MNASRCIRIARPTDGGASVVSLRADQSTSSTRTGARSMSAAEQHNSLHVDNSSRLSIDVSCARLRNTSAGRSTCYSVSNSRTRKLADCARCRVCAITTSVLQVMPQNSNAGAIAIRPARSRRLRLGRTR